MTAFWVAIPVGLLIVLFAVGIPYWLSHRNLHPQKDRSEAHAYLETTGKTAEDAVSGRPGRRWRNLQRSKGYRPAA